MKKKTSLFIGVLVCIVAGWMCGGFQQEQYTGWTTFAGSKEGNRYSSNDQINTENVKKLAVAWEYSAGDSTAKSGVPCNPIVIKGKLYGVDGKMRLFALDAAIGKQLWQFAPLDSNAKGAIRGVAYWDGGENEGRIFYGAGACVYAVDAASGKIAASFGGKGYIDLRENLDGNYAKAYVAGNAPGVVFGNLLIVGMRVSEGHDAAPGHIRAYDVRTGECKWIFHTIPHPGEFGFDSWEDTSAWRRTGGANNWAGMSLDEKRGIVYVPTGSATPDFYGGNRKGANLFANSIIALDAATGKYIWHYQVIHHDLWDRDLPANPNLITVKHEGRQIDAVAQITKHGYIFLLDRETGKPIFPIEEVQVPPSDLPGEMAWPTQPIPSLPEPFARQKLDSSEITDRTPEARKEMLEKFRKLRSGNGFIPPSEQGGFIFPGFDGGGQWGGAAVDAETKILYVNASELPWWTAMIENPVLKSKESRTLKELGQNIYNINCINCHGQDLKGNGKLVPSLLELEKNMSEAQARKVIENGRDRMPAFSHLAENQKAALLAFLLNLEDKELTTPQQPAKTAASAPPQKSFAPPYTNTGYNRFYDSEGYPGIKPPWGTLNAVDLNSGKLLWKVPLGEYPALTKLGIPITGTPNYGGPVVTKGGIIFIGATPDKKFRAFDKNTGKVLWEAELPGEGRATPACYMADGRQFVVIASGVGANCKYVAFALPKE
jgi:quinoprotein glucose dehydrogenase